MVLHTGSGYVRNGITRWHTCWVRKGWKNAAGDPVANMDLWRRLLDAAKPHAIEWKWSGVSNWNGPYLKGDAAPLDPWNHPYSYRNPSQRAGHDYDLCSAGPTGDAGAAAAQIRNP